MDSPNLAKLILLLLVITLLGSTLNSCAKKTKTGDVSLAPWNLSRIYDQTINEYGASLYSTLNHMNNEV